MSNDEIYPERIGPQLSLADVSFPAALGERFQTLYGTDEPPANGRQWVEQMRTTIASVRDREPTVEDLCAVEDGEHAFAADGDQSYRCVLDPLAYPFLTGETGTVRSETPVRDATVTVEIGADEFDVDPPDAVVSLGVSDRVEHVETVDLETVYRQVCGYVQTFEDADEYETWAADVGAATMPLSAAEGVAVAREIADALFVDDR